MTDRTRTTLFVALVAAAAAAAAIAAFHGRLPYPGLWALSVFILTTFVLDLAASPLRVGAWGSTSFIICLAAGLLFGSFWGAVVSASGILLQQLWIKSPTIKVVFNVAQRTLSLTVGAALYMAVGGQFPPSYVFESFQLSSPEVQRDLGLFFVFAAGYFAVNTVVLNLVVAIHSGRRFREVWNLNARGVLGYDLGGSTLAIVLAWLYSSFERSLGFGAIGFVAVLAPILAVRHVYGLYRKLQNSSRELLDLMVKAIEARDPYTSGHSVRVATLSKAIAQELKVPAERIEEVYTAALLHDVGKIHEEFAPLLRKDTKLTPEETALLQTHAVKSAELVGLISSFRGHVQDSVRHHHERWDGGGYPDGIAGEEIPLGARIIMMADTADAMMTDRPYRRRLTLEAVVAEFQKYRGTQFDPELVDLVVNSVTIRRVMADLQGADGTNLETKPMEGGSRKVVVTSRKVFASRPSWPRIKAF
ncbi:MAG TPA: HD domain-containing phosphohydrolase [Alphaproteobacteria bacterium]|nr:HD domain-containing phosphohydrolase [Alphaproteobacteria bacterium]